MLFVETKINLSSAETVLLSPFFDLVGRLFELADVPLSTLIVSLVLERARQM